MILGFILVLNTLIILASVLLLGRFISNNNKNEQQRIIEMFKEFKSFALGIHEMTVFLIDTQKALDNKMNALSVFVDNHSTNVAFQQEHFNANAKADMLTARREELRRTKELKIALERLMGVALTSRQPPAPNDILALENLTERIKELETILN